MICVMLKLLREMTFLEGVSGEGKGHTMLCAVEIGQQKPCLAYGDRSTRFLPRIIFIS